MADNIAEILLVEDETNVGLTLRERLQREGYSVTLANTLAQAHQSLAGHLYHLAIIDVGLPDGDGFEIAQRLREQQSACAIIFLTAFGAPEDRVRGLELGAEDYVVKPFHLRELMLRIRNGLKRVHYIAHGSELLQKELILGKATLKLAQFKVMVGGKEQSLTHKECALLKFLLERRGKVVSRDEILNFVWSDEEFPTPRTVDNFIVRLRRLVETDPDRPELIKSVRGVGYQLV